MAAPAKRRKAVRLVTGDKQIDKMLSQIGDIATANRIARSGLTKAVRVIVKGMKAEVPASAKSVKKTMKGYVKQGKKKGVTLAKAGAVGKQVDGTKDRAGKEGVGIASPNVHWFLIGTKRRRPKKKRVMKTSLGRFMGREVKGMPAHPVVKDGWRKTQPEARRVLYRGIQDAFKRETAKAIAKYKAKWGGG